jgi:hypothetical protein
LIFEFGFEFDFFTLKIELINPAKEGSHRVEVLIRLYVKAPLLGRGWGRVVKF